MAEPITGSFFQRGSLLFFAILINAFGAALEVRRDSRIKLRAELTYIQILTLYAQRPIVEKHTQYAL